jgi:aminopeptidase N
MPTARPDAPAPTRDVLTRDEAAGRAARVGAIAYDLALALTAEETTYRGEARLAFAVRGTDDLFLDFRGGTIERLEVNGTPVDRPDRPGARIVLPGELLAPDTRVRVVYENAYDRNGDGFHRFVDPVDGEVYIYSNFEPFEAHRLFPCFDQPDLKGTLAIRVTAPASWAVVSNNPIERVDEASDGRRTHRFVTTPPISTYLAAVIAGPYVGVHAEHRGIPLGVWSRRSVAPFVDADEIFAITRQGMDFYTALFSRPYPFAKYDQIFVPEFNAGAMENAGAVTFTEQHVYRDPPTETQRLGRAETILHELAHMWFGDLVTMRWWDDLWLNESFATYVSTRALADATRFEGAWRAFHADMKRWGYQADDRSTTHPISGVVADTDATFYNFDGITYGKGAAVLKQLVAWVGRDAFSAGLRVYFERHAWGNASLADFLAALEEGSGRDLGDWAQRWVETSSMNVLSAHWTVAGGRIERLELVQEAP